MIKNKFYLINVVFLISFSIMVIVITSLIALEYNKLNAMELDGNEYDQVFLENINVLAKDNYGNDINLVAEKELLYDLNLKEFGCIYNFAINGEKGYAIVINAVGEFELTEIYFDAENPYTISNNAKRIYVSNMIYLYYDSNNFYSAKNDVLLNNDDIDNLKSVALYCGYDDLKLETETINYVSKTEDTYQVAKKYPYIVDSLEFSNECAVIVGANIIQYWDRFCVDLIPNYNPGKPLLSFYMYNGESETTDKLISDLYYDMETNSYSAGTTISQFKLGLQKYVSKNGNYSLNYTSCMANNIFDYNSAKQYLDDAQPIALFLSGFNIVKITAINSIDDVSIKSSNNNHAMVAFGYKDIKYYLSNGTQRNDKYLQVATGVQEQSTGYFNINYKTNIDDAFAIKIC